MLAHRHPVSFPPGVSTAGGARGLTLKHHCTEEPWKMKMSGPYTRATQLESPRVGPKHWCVFKIPPSDAKVNTELRIPGQDLDSGERGWLSWNPQMDQVLLQLCGFHQSPGYDRQLENTWAFRSLSPLYIYKYTHTYIYKKQSQSPPQPLTFFQFKDTSTIIEITWTGPPQNYNIHERLADWFH